MSASKDRSRTGISTLAVHAGPHDRRPGAPVVPPLIASSTFYNDPEAEGEIRYGRYANTENHERVSQKLAALERAESALLTGSGMAAISTAILSCVGAGDHIVAADALYGGTRTLLTRELPRLGIQTTFADPVSGWSAEVQANTRLLYMELPVNPTLQVPDPRPIVSLARERGIPLVVDATFATPVNFRPLEHGADLVVHSATKYLGGHSDLVAGVLAGSRDRILRATEVLRSFGPSLDPHAIWLLDRGIRTLGIRIQRQNETALDLAHWLHEHPLVEAVHYPGLPTHPDHQVASTLLDGFGGMLAFVVRGGDAAAREVIKRFELIAVAPSLGGVESLVSMPRYTSHAALSAAERRSAGIADGFLRLSVGIEDAQDLRADLDDALRAVLDEPS